MDVYSHKKGISIVGSFPSKRLSASNPLPPSLEPLYKHSIHPSLKDICGQTVFPPDNGHALIQSIKQSNKQIFASSDASLKNGRSTHAWVISTGQTSNFSDPYMHIKGAGAVHGHKKYLSSCRGEFQGLSNNYHRQANIRLYILPMQG